MSEPKRILVVDDEPAVLMLVQKVLTRAGYVVESAASGEDAMRRLKVEPPPDLMLIDKNLPHMHGAEVIVEARRLLPQLAVVLITAFPEPFALPPERLDGYLPKPFKNLKSIEDAVAQALEAREAEKVRGGLRERLTQVVADLSPVAKKRTL